MTPNEFIAKWRKGGDERRDWHSFFDDVCRLVGHPTPRDADPEHSWFTYEYGVGKAGGGIGWADAWKKGFFGWEAKGTGKDLTKAYAQLKMYSDDLQNPPVLVVCDLQKFEVHTNFTNSVKEIFRFSVEDLAKRENREILEAVFKNPQSLRPGMTRSGITEDAAGKFADLAWALRERGEEPHAVAHFLNRLVFCMFAEDIGLLPESLFARMVEGSQNDPEAFEANARQLFAAMQKGGQAGFVRVDWFNGGLFDHDDTLRLEPSELKTLLGACRLDWSQIDPSIFGTLFERGLDPGKRAQLGAHYTDPATIMKIIRPVIIEPWIAEWEIEKKALSPLVERAAIFGLHKGESAAQKGARTKAQDAANQRVGTFLERLRAFTVLDPACGSGNFLFMALRALKDIEHRIIVEAEELGLSRHFPGVSPQAVKGIEINAYAAELARITVWIGELQWMIQNGHGARKNPILLPLDQIENRDALLKEDGSETSWPAADVILGNPPFVGDKKMKSELGVEYTEALRKAFRNRVPGAADLVCFWFEKANDAIRRGTATRAGLVSTNSIRGGANQKVLSHIARDSLIFEAWSDLPWVNEGAAVRVALTCFGGGVQEVRLDGGPVAKIFANLSAGGAGGQGVNLTLAKELRQNKDCAYLGIQKTGPFEIEGHVAREWLSLPNPHAMPNSDVVRPWWNGLDITGRPRDFWIIDFGPDSERSDAELYEAPFAYAQEHVQPTRVGKREARTNEQWWIFQWPRPVMRKAVKGLQRYIATPETPTHTVFAWIPGGVVPDKNLVVIARDDDTTFGILHSTLHLVWVRAIGSPYGNHPTARRYNSSRVFETFPFPDGLTPNTRAEDYREDPRAERIAIASRNLIERRDQWLNPTEWVNWVTSPKEEEAGFPRRPVPKLGHEKEVAKRTLTNLYNERPAWLLHLHRALDEAVAGAYGWDWPLAEDEILLQLFELNQARQP